MSTNNSLRNYLHGAIMTGMLTFGQKTEGESLGALIIRAEGLNLPGAVVCIPAAAVIINHLTAAERGTHPHRLTASPSAVRQLMSAEGVHISALEVRHAAGYLAAMLEDIHAGTDIKKMPTQLPTDKRLATYFIAARELTRVAARVLLPEQRGALIQLWERCPDPENVQLLLIAATLSGETAAGVRTLPRWNEAKTMAVAHQAYIIEAWLRAATAHLIPGTPVNVPAMPGCGCAGMCPRHTELLSSYATMMSQGGQPGSLATGIATIPKPEMLHFLYTAAHVHAATLATVTAPAA